MSRKLGSHDSEDKGRFCGSCQKKVFDFTSSSDREIINAFEKNNNLCGRFLNTQLNRDLVKLKEKSTLWLAATTALISLVGLNEVIAQEKAPTELTDQRMLGKFIATPVIEVSGIVSDKTGPLPGAKVFIKGTTIEVQTDFDGKFLIKANANDTLSISFLGMLDKEIRIEKSEQDIIILLEEDNKFEKIYMGGYSKSEKYFKGFGPLPHNKRTFFGRIFHSIGNWFK